MDKLRDGYVLEDLKLYVDNILAIQNPNLLTGITSRLIVDHETGERLDEFNKKVIQFTADTSSLNNFPKSEGKTIYVKNKGLYTCENNTWVFKPVDLTSTFVTPEMFGAIGDRCYR